MQTRYLYVLRFVLGLTDIILVNLALAIAYYFTGEQHEQLSRDAFQHYFMVCNLIWLFSVSMFGLYRQQTIERVETIYRASWKSVFFHGVFFVFYLALSKDHSLLSRTFLFIFYFIMGTGFLASRFIGTVFETILARHFKIRKPVAVLGMNRTALRLAAYFEENSSNYRFEGFLDEEDGLGVDENGQILSAATSQIRKAADSGIREVYVSLTPERIADAGDLLREAERLCVRVKFVPDLIGSIAAPFTVNYMGEFPVINLRHEPLEDMQNRFKKRFIDMLFSLAVIVFIMSWLYPIIALIIKIQSPGPVLFKQLRSGRDNRPFWCYKFRSMHVNNESDTKQASKNDDRITPIGRFLRKTSMDELPQFFNVLFGHMSVVGPRPHMLKHTEQYSSIISQFMVRHFLKPGITGWAQVNGLRGETKDHKLMEKRVEYDIWYMENWSAMLDVKIVFMTIINVFKGEENAH